MPDAGRVITGSARGLRLGAPGEGTRPLSDRVKQALFGLIESERPDAWESPFLDLFAGSGAAGIEALSRGAPRALFVELDGRAVRVIRNKIGRTRLEARGRILRRDAVALLRAGAASLAESPVGVVVLDPPYGQTDRLADCLVALGEPSLGWLDRDAVVVAKHFWRDVPKERAGELQRMRERRFGETALSVYRAVPTRPEDVAPTRGGP
ncbi:16S rRNA (guanine(966)-N(2))-methyltransferase RsmD [soil metagenome]